MKNHPIFAIQKDALFILGYFDDLEIANPLGSKANYYYTRWISTLIRVSLQCYCLFDEHCTLFFFDYTFHKQAHFVFLDVFFYLLVNIYPVYQSTIRNIQHIGIAKTQDIKRHDIDKMLKPFTCELKELGVCTVHYKNCVLSITKTNIFNNRNLHWFTWMCWFVKITGTGRS